MRVGSALCIGGMFWLAACGGGGSNGPSNTIWAGSLTVDTAGTAGAACATTHPVTFTASGASVHTLTLQGDDCLDFTNSDTVPHMPQSIGTRLCAELDAPAQIAPGAHWATAPFLTVGACQWQDALHPVPSGGGSGY